MDKSYLVLPEVRYLRIVFFIILVASALVTAAPGQNVPLGVGRSVGSRVPKKETAEEKALREKTERAEGRETPKPKENCTDADSDAPWSYPFFLPLNSNVTNGVHALVGNDGKPVTAKSQAAVQCFFNTNQSLQPLSLVQYLYGFGTSPSTVSVDMVSLSFPLGFQASFGSSVTGNSKTASVTPGQATPAQAVQQLQAGGDFYVRGTYPILFKKTDNLTSMLVFNPKLGFNISGFGSQNTVTEATEFNWNESVEGYTEYRAFSSSTDPGGALYVDGRVGAQGVQAPFARSIGIPGKTEFLMGQVSFGILFNGFIRVGAQRFFGPAQLYASAPGAPVTNQSDFKKWHLVLQLAPHK